MSNTNPFRPLTHWIIKPPYATRFVSHIDGSIDIEFEPGREDEVKNYLFSWLDALHAHTVNSRQVAPAAPAPTAQSALLAPAVPAQSPLAQLVNPTGATSDPGCEACKWALSHPNTRCQVHNPPPGA